MRQHTAFGVKKVPISPTELRPTFMLHSLCHLPKRAAYIYWCKSCLWDRPLGDIQHLQIARSILIQFKVKYIIFLIMNLVVVNWFLFFLLFSKLSVFCNFAFYCSLSHFPVLPKTYLLLQSLNPIILQPGHSPSKTFVLPSHSLV